MSTVNHLYVDDLEERVAALNKKKNKTGIIVGIVIGLIILAVIAYCAFFFIVF